MEFDPNNHVVRLCIQGMALEEKGEAEEARRHFLRAWNEGANDLEKFIAAHPGYADLIDAEHPGHPRRRRTKGVEGA